MTTPTDRFFEAYARLLDLGATSQSQLCREIGCERRNFAKQAADHGRRILKLEWLTVLVERYNVSADWLLTGRGWMFEKQHKMLNN